MEQKEKTSLSSSWRINKSPIKVIELANSIKALAKVVGAIDPKTKLVSYSSTTRSVNQTLAERTLIDPTFALKNFPILPENFDILVGLAAHEGGHTLTGSEKVLSIMAPQSMSVKSNPVSEASIATIGEEIYTDNYLKRHLPLLHKYLAVTRKEYNVEREKINWADIIAAWSAIAVYGNLPSSLTPPRITQALKVLMGITTKLTAKDISTHDRVNMYKQAYSEIASIIKQQEIERKLRGNRPDMVIESHEKQQRDYEDSNEAFEPGDGVENGEPTNNTEDLDNKANNGGEEGEQETDSEIPDESAGQDGEKKASEENDDGYEQARDQLDEDIGEQGDWDEAEIKQAIEELKKAYGKTKDNEPDSYPTSESGDRDNALLPNHYPMSMLSESMMESIQETIEQELEDITEKLHDILQPYHNDVAGAIIWQLGKGEESRDFDENLYKDLIWVNSLKTSLGRETFRGEPRGKIDVMRLHRANIDGKVFKVTRKKPYKEPNLVMLLDASSSMQGNDNPIYNAARALHKVLPQSTVITYYGNNVQTTIEVNAAKNQPFRHIRTSDSTPSGQAILATAQQFPDSFLIHFTDGGNNIGPSPEKIFDVIYEQYPKIHIFDVRYGNRNKNSGIQHTNYNPRTTIVEIGDVSQFPDVLKEAIKPWYMS